MRDHVETNNLIQEVSLAATYITRDGTIHSVHYAIHIKRMNTEYRELLYLI